MKKTSLFLVVLLWAACSAFAATESYFCLQKFDVLLYGLSQQKATAVVKDEVDGAFYLGNVDDGIPCFEKWYDPDGVAAGEGEPSPLSPDLITYLNASIEYDEGTGLELYLTSDLDFGGLNGDSTACVNDFKPLALEYGNMWFSGKDLYTGEIHKITNFCYIADVSKDVASAGFFSKVSSNSTVQGFIFDSPYVMTKNFPENASSIPPVGIVAGTLTGGATIANVTITNGTVKGLVAGGVVGQMEGASVDSIHVDGLNVLLSSDVFASETGTSISVDAPKVALGGVAGFSGAMEPDANYIKYVAMTDLNVRNEMPELELSDATSAIAYLGAFVGYADFGDYDYIRYSYAIGDVSSAGTTDKVGFVAGHVNISENVYNVFQAIFFYGTSATAEYCAGDIVWNDTPVSSDTIITNAGAIIMAVFRNAIDGLSVTGSLREDGYLLMPGETLTYGYTGVLSEADIKSPKLAYAFNYSVGSGTWAWKRDVNESLPFFKDPDVGSAPFMIRFAAVTRVRDSLPDTLFDLLKDHGRENGDSVLALFFTDSSGTLDDSFADTLYAIEGYAWLDDGFYNVAEYPYYSNSTTVFMAQEKEMTLVVNAIDYDDMGSPDTVRVGKESLEGYEAYYGFVPNEKIKVMDMGYHLYAEDFEKPLFHYANDSEFKNGKLNSVALSIESGEDNWETHSNSIDYYWTAEKGMEYIVSYYGGTGNLSDTVYLYYDMAQIDSLSTVKFYVGESEGTSTVQMVGYVPDGLITADTISPKRWLNAGDETVLGLSHGYKFGYEKPGYQADSFDITVEILTDYNSATSTAVEGEVDSSKLGSAEAFSGLLELWSKVAEHAAYKVYWNFKMSSEDVLVADSLYAFMRMAKEIGNTGDSLRMSITMVPDVKATIYEVSFTRLVDGNYFYEQPQNWFDKREYSLDSYDTDLPVVFGIDEESGRPVCYEWTIDPENPDAFMYLDESSIEFLNPKAETHLYPISVGCGDISTQTVQTTSQAEGSVVLQQVVGNEDGDVRDTIVHTFQSIPGDAGEKLLMYVPVREEMRLQLAALPEEGFVLEYALRLVPSGEDASGEVLYDTSYVYNGEDIYVTESMILEPRFRENRTYYLTYDFGGDEETVFYFGEDFNLVKTFTTADNELELPHIFRADSAFAGWTFGRGEDYGMRADDGGSVGEPGKEHGWSYIGYSDVEEFGHGDTLDLTALWTEATGEDVYLNEVVFLNDSVGTVTLTQTIDGKDYVTKVGAEGVSIPNVERYGTSLLFTVGVELNAGYAHNDTLYMTIDGITDTIAVGSEITLGVLDFDITFEGNFTHTDHAISFKHVASDSVFYAEDWFVDGVWSDDRRYSLSSEEMNFPVIYGMGAAGNTFCYQWSVDPENEESRHTYFDWSPELSESETPVVLAPVVGECSEEVIAVPVKLALGGDGNPVEGFGTIALTQVVGSEESEFGLDTIAHGFMDDGSGNRVMNVPYAGKWLHFQIEAMPEEGYALDYVVVLVEGDGGSYEVRDTLRAGDELILERPVSLEPHFTGNRTYYVSYKLEAEDEILYYTSKWAPQDSFTTEDRGLRMPRGLYRTDACLAGWTIENEGSPAAEDVVPLQEIWYNQMEELGKDSVTMVALWDSTGEFCEVSNVRVRFLDDTAAVVTLTRTVNGVDYDVVVGAEDVLIPQVDEGFPFTVGVEMNAGYASNDSLFVSMNGTADTIAVGSVLNLGMQDVEFAGEFSHVDYALAFRHIAGDSLFYAEDWYEDGAWSDDRRYSLSSEEMNFPVIYGMGAAGNTFCYQWSVDPDNVESLHSDFDWSLELVEAEMPLVLAPVVGECSEEVIAVPVKLSLGGDGNPVEGFGTIALTQVVGSEESEFGLDTIAHEFVDDGTGNSIVNVPYAGRWLHFQIKPMPAEGYALDYVVVLTENDAGGYDVRDTLRGADELVLERPVALEPHFTGNRTYYVSYKLEAEDEILYYTSKWAPQDSFTTEDHGLRMPRGLYRTDACLAGWIIENEGTPAAEDVVPLQEIWYNQMEELGRDSVTMVALWDSTGEFCEVSNVRVRFLDDTAAVVTLTRTVNGVDYDIVVGAEDVLIPQVDEGFPFTVKVVAKDSIIWDGLTMSLAGEMTMIQSGDEIILGKKDVAFTGVFRKLEPQPPLPPLTIDSLPEFAENTHLEVSGNALLFAYGVKHCSETEETVIRITLDGPIAGTTSLKLASEETCNRGWELHPLTPGKYHFKAVALRGFVPNSSVEGNFEVVATIASPGKDSWQMVGLNAVDADSVVMDDDVRFFWWNESKNYGEFWQYYTLTDLSAFENGRGYWYSSLSGRALPLKDSVEIPKDGFKLEWALDSLNSGWNLVSNPFGWEIDLGVSDDADVTFWRWNAETAEYERATSVGPYEAVWAKVGGAVKWSLNVEPVFGENVVITELEFKKENVANSNENPGDMPTLKFEGKSVPLPPAKSKKPEDGGYAGKVDSTGTGSGDDAGKSLAKAANTMEWSIRAILSDGNGKRDSWNVLGVGARNVAWEEPPAGMGNHVNLSIMDGKRSLAKSVKTANASKATAADNAYEWQVELSASTARMGYLSFEGLDAIGKLGYRVFVTVDGFTQEVAAGSAVEVPLTSLAKTATVRVAAEPRKTLTYALGGLRMVQSGSLLNVTFMASDGLAGSGLTVEVLDLKGKVAARTVGNAVSGANSATLTAPAGGLYMLRVRAGSAQTSGKIVVK